MERIAKISMLIDFYGKLLTDRQYSIIDMYYNNDYSLSEIADILGISRQGVHDGLKRAENSLFMYEEKLELVEKFLQRNNNIKHVIEKLIKINSEHKNSKEISKCIEILKEKIVDNEL